MSHNANALVHRRRNCKNTHSELKYFQSGYIRIRAAYHRMQLNCWKSVVTNVPKLSKATPLASIGEWILICRRWVSRPFWWLLMTAIWIMNVLMGLSFKSFRGTLTQPVGSVRPTTSTSWRSLKLVPDLIDILKQINKKIIKKCDCCQTMTNNSFKQYTYRLGV